MNRFLTRKKTREALDAADAHSLTSQTSQSSKEKETKETKETKKSKKWRKAEPEPQPKFDLTYALPSSDNFRTSLIMPTLSTRFSMLREQDDPSSKLGKASDDSVLAPRRQSRLMEFGFRPGGLDDIAEVSSINGSVRPPFAAKDRQDSFASSEGPDDGSIHSGSMMTRARPGEGNNLFGGRQKVYKIAAGSQSTKSLGKVLYEDDVHMSAFQKQRQADRERERLAREKLEESESEEKREHAHSLSKDLTYSPSLSGYSTSRKRETSSSSTTDPNTRLSTAATSIASQGANAIPPPAFPSASAAAEKPSLERSTTKIRRLYEQGLEQQAKDQQSSTLTRLNSVARHKAVNGKSIPPFLSQTKSAVNLSDRFNFPTPIVEPVSPPLSGGAQFVAEGRELTFQSGRSTAQSNYQSPPLSPIGMIGASDNDSDSKSTPLNSSINPKDRGKATAMGMFNKPTKFDEKQYLQRQLSLHQGRNTPPPSRRRAVTDGRLPPGETSSRTSPEPMPEETIPEVPTPEPEPTKKAPNAFSVFQNAARQNRWPQSEETSQPESVAPERTEKPNTFFASPSESDAEEEEESVPMPPVKQRPEQRQATHGVLRMDAAAAPIPPALMDHPAFRSTRPALSPEDLEGIPPPPPVKDVPEIAKSAPEDDNEGHVESSDVDSPTLCERDDENLSGLIRQHLRHRSNVSSIYSTVPPPAPLRTQGPGLRPNRNLNDTESVARSSYSPSNPWDLEDFDTGYYIGDIDSPSSGNPADQSSLAAGSQSASRSGSLRRPRRQGSTKQTAPSNEAPWEREMRKQHTRGPSTETQAEREAFANEMAERQRAIQESLRTKMEETSRASSPTPSMGGARKTLGILRSKSSKEFITPSRDTPAKAMKMLGLTGAMTGSSSTNLAALNEQPHEASNWRPEEDHDERSASGATRRKASNRDMENSIAGAESVRSIPAESRRPVPSSKPRSEQSSGQSSVRDRSSSGVSSGRARSRSRGRPFRDDLDRAMADGTSSIYYESSPQIPEEFLPAQRSSPEVFQTPTLTPGGRARANSRTMPPVGYFEGMLEPPVPPTPPTTYGLPSSPRLGALGARSAARSPNQSPQIGAPTSPLPRASPIPFTSPSMPELPRAAPRAPSSANSTPVLSTTSTPIPSAFSSKTSTPAPSRTPSGPYRKKSVNKDMISEPTLISYTSEVPTMDLPPGASLRNGMDAPPVPPINPLRRRFGFGRSESQHPRMPPSASGWKPGHKLRKSSSEGENLAMLARAHASTKSTPALVPAHILERERSRPRPPVAPHGAAPAMF